MSGCERAAFGPNSRIQYFRYYHVVIDMPWARSVSSISKYRGVDLHTLAIYPTLREQHRHFMQVIHFHV
jgi:hypothetical protein